MGPDWQTCSKCGLLIPPQPDARRVDSCPACGQPLVAAPPAADETEWFYEINRKKHGPVPLSRIAELFARGELAPTSLVRRESETKWRRLRDVSELRPGRRPKPAMPDDSPGTFFARHRRRPYELIAAAVVVVLATIGYALASRSGLPRPSGLLGHGLGIVGFLLMLATETLYSLRKQSGIIGVGRSSTWLQVHIFTGIVGPYLVLLHSAGKFQGIAGVVSLLTVLIVLSGFVGRYIYTAVPRTADGAELALREVDGEIERDAVELKRLGMSRMNAADLAAAMAPPPSGWILVFGRPWLAWRRRRLVARALAAMPDVDDELSGRIANLLLDRYRLMIIKESLPVTRRLMAVWHLVHVPMGAIMFALAFLHVAGALYYTALSR